MNSSSPRGYRDLKDEELALCMLIYKRYMPSQSREVAHTKNEMQLADSSFTFHFLDQTVCFQINQEKIIVLNKSSCMLRTPRIPDDFDHGWEVLLSFFSFFFPWSFSFSVDLFLRNCGIQIELKCPKFLHFAHTAVSRNRCVHIFHNEITNY